MFDIATVLAADTAAVNKKEAIYGALRLPRSELEDLKRKVFLDNSGSLGFFSAMLDAYLAKKGTVPHLIACLKQYQLISVAGRLTWAWEG